MAESPGSVMWKLDSVTTTTAFNSGSVVGMTEKIHADTTGFAIANYKWFQRFNQGSKGWVQETAQNEGRYIEFNTACSDTTTGSYVTITNVSLNYGCAGSTNAMKGNFWYSKDHWATRTQLGSTLVFPNNILTSFSSSLSVTIAKGDTFSLRIYPYWYTTATISTSKYASFDSVVIAGVSGVYASPSVATDSITNVTLTTATGGGIVTFANGFPVTARGVCWNTTGMPTISDPHTTDSSGLGTFVSSLAGLNEGTYYVRAYATNSMGTGYGPQVIFTINASALSPTVTTTTVSNITTFTAISGGSVTSDGGVTVTARGVCWNTTGMPKISDSVTIDGSGTGSYSSSLNNLTSNTVYYVRAYAVNSVGTSYGTQVTFTSAQRTDSTITGAYGDSVHLDTKAIQAAIDSMAGLGGGIVMLAHGNYLSGPLTLRNNITFYIDSTATLLATQNVKLYYPVGVDTNTNPSSLQDFISSSYANNITITGYGTIDGQGSPWWAAENIAKARGADTLRPRMINLANGSHIVITHITIKNAPMFNICPNTCYDVKIDSVTILAPSTSPNTDGIDPGKCHHVRITNCNISNGDDNVAVGAGSSDIVVSHCTFGTGHGVSIGSYTNGGVDTMLVDSCTFSGTTNGIRIKSARDRGGKVQNITYSNLSMTNVRYPIYFTEYYPDIPTTDTAQATTSTTPYFHNITIKNLTASNSASNSMVGYAVGLPEKMMDNIHFQNVSIVAYKGLQVRNASIDTVNTSITVTSGAPYILQTYGTVTAPTTGVEQTTAVVPSQIQLLQNYPNPFNPSTQITYTLAKRSTVALIVYDLLGREVSTLVNEIKEAGTYTVTLNGAKLSSGVYFYRLQSGSFVQTKKMVLLK